MRSFIAWLYYTGEFLLEVTKTKGRIRTVEEGARGLTQSLSIEGGRSLLFSGKCQYMNQTNGMGPERVRLQVSSISIANIQLCSTR